MSIVEVKIELSKLGQAHLVSQLEKLQGSEYQDLESDILHLDLNLISELLAQVESNSSLNNSGEDLKSDSIRDEVAPHPFNSQAEQSSQSHAKWSELGQEALSEGKVGALLVAGGQGSRLGFDGPKGAYRFDLDSGASLFQLHAQRILNLGQRLGKELPWAIMTSPQNHDETIEHFEQHDYFGLSSDQIVFFQQGVLPAISQDGKIILASASRIQTAPDGNGGCFKAFHQSEVFHQWQKLGIEHLYIFSVDNCLVRPLDPRFIGFYLDNKKSSASTVVKKAYPAERVGIFALKNQLPTVIEYSELNDEQINATNSQGDLLYDGGNMAIHLIDMKILQEAATAPLAYHQAYKKISFWNGTELVHPSEPNAIKFEQFMFDIFPRCQSMALLEVERTEHFAPIKNAEGNDSPQSAKFLLLNLHKKWLAKALNINESNLDGQYEISPLLSYQGENLPSTLDEVKTTPLIFRS